MVDVDGLAVQGTTGFIATGDKESPAVGCLYLDTE